MSMADRLRLTEERLDEFSARERAGAATAIVDDAEVVGIGTIAVGRVDDLGTDGTRSLAFQVRDRIAAGVGIIGSVTDGKAALVVFVTEDLVASGVSAGDIAAAGAIALGGGGSKDAKLAQAGGPNADGMDEAIAVARAAAVEALTAR